VGQSLWVQSFQHSCSIQGTAHCDHLYTTLTSTLGRWSSQISQLYHEMVRAYIGRVISILPLFDLLRLEVQ